MAVSSTDTNIYTNSEALALPAPEPRLMLTYPGFEKSYDVKQLPVDQALVPFREIVVPHDRCCFCGESGGQFTVYPTADGRHDLSNRCHYECIDRDIEEQRKRVDNLLKEYLDIRPAEQQNTEAAKDPEPFEPRKRKVKVDSSLGYDPSLFDAAKPPKASAIGGKERTYSVNFVDAIIDIVSSLFPCCMGRR